jgi:hypothetical protein
MDWSMNFEHPRPGALLLDLCGYSEYNYGGPILTEDKYDKVLLKLGYLELDLLGKALIAYASYPIEIGEWIFEYEGSTR